MIHISGDKVGRGRPYARPVPDADLVVFGHSHIPWDTEQDGQRLFNPGSPTDKRRQPRGTMGRLVIDDGLLLSAEIIAVTLDRRQHSGLVELGECSGVRGDVEALGLEPRVVVVGVAVALATVAQQRHDAACLPAPRISPISWSDAHTLVPVDPPTDGRGSSRPSALPRLRRLGHVDHVVDDTADE